MHGFAEETITRILSLLPGKDVARFRQLNKRFCELAKEYRNYFAYPKLIFEISDDGADDFEKYGKRIFIKLNYGKYCAIRCSNPEAISVKTFEDSFTEKLLEPFFGRKHDSQSILHSIWNNCSKKKRSLRAMLDFLLEKANITLVCNLKHPKFIRILTECIKNTRNSIEFCEFVVNFKFSSTPLTFAWFYILEAVGSRKLPLKHSKEMTLLVDGDGKKVCEVLRQLRKLNELASMFQFSRLVINKWIAAPVLTRIAMEWRYMNFSDLRFDILLYTFNGQPTDYDIKLEKIYLIRANFNVHQMRPRQFLSTSNEPSIIRLEDKETGNVLQFEKRSGPKKWFSHSGNFEWTTLKITISVFRK